MGVEDGTVHLDGLADGGQVATGSGHVVLLEHQAQCFEMVGKLMGQAALGGVGFHQGFRPLLLQCGTVLRILFLHHLLVEHLDKEQVHQHRHREPHRKQHAELSGVEPAARDHQQHVEHHDHSREEHGNHQLQRFQRLLLAPVLCHLSRDATHDEHRRCHEQDAQRLPDHLRRRNRFDIGIEIRDCIFRQQADHTVDHAGHQFLADGPAKKRRCQQQIQHVGRNGSGIEKAKIDPERNYQHPAHCQPRTDKGMFPLAFAQHLPVDEGKHAILHDADQVHQQLHLQLIAHRQTALSTPDKRPGWLHSRSG